MCFKGWILSESCHSHHFTRRRLELEQIYFKAAWDLYECFMSVFSIPFMNMSFFFSYPSLCPSLDLCSPVDLNAMNPDWYFHPQESSPASCCVSVKHLLQQLKGKWQSRLSMQSLEQPTCLLAFITHRDSLYSRSCILFHSTWSMQEEKKANISFTFDIFEKIIGYN